MPRYRCPYCRKIFEGGTSARCPHCHRVSVVPAALRKTTYRERERMRGRIEREVERHRDKSVLPDSIRFGRSPWVVGMVIGVFLILGAVLIGSANRLQSPVEQQRLSREERALRELDVLRMALDRFHDDVGRYPTMEEGLQALVLDPGIEGWDGNYINLLGPDPWRMPYQYEMTAEGPRVRSFGPDRKPLTEYDLTVP